MVITVLEAEVPPERQEELRRTFEQGDEEPRPDALHESYLVKLRDTNTCQMITVWKSMQGLLDYRNSVETPGGILVFRSVGAEPKLSVSEVLHRLEPESA